MVVYKQRISHILANDRPLELIIVGIGLNLEVIYIFYDVYALSLRALGRLNDPAVVLFERRLIQAVVIVVFFQILVRVGGGVSIFITIILIVLNLLKTFLKISHFFRQRIRFWSKIKLIEAMLVLHFPHVVRVSILPRQLS